jgi:nucleotide-binding universal stress UspA family protein
VLQHAAKPVLAVRDGDPTVQFGKILCPVDMSATSARGLANALQLARAFRGELVVVTVVPTPHWLAGFPEIRNLPDGGTSNEHTWRDEFNQFLAMAGVGDIRCEHEIRSGQPHDEIIASARAHGADLIVMGSTGRTGLARILMGSVIRRVIQQLPCSILAVKQQNVLEELHDDELQTIQVLYAQGRGLLGARSYETALERFSHVLLHDPFHAGALAGKAAALDALGRNEEAERCRKRAGMIEEGEKQEFDLGGGD